MSAIVSSNFFAQKFFLTKIFNSYFCSKKVFDDKLFWEKNLQNFCWLKMFFFSNKNVFDQTFFLTKIYFDQKKILSKIYFAQKFLLTKFLLTKEFPVQNFLSVHFLTQHFLTNFFFTKIFDWNFLLTNKLNMIFEQ